MGAFFILALMKPTSLLELLLSSDGVSIDSRTIRPGQLFFGLSGTQADGSQYAKNALDAGARAVVVQGGIQTIGEDDRFWYVDDVLLTMQTLAREYRQFLKCTVLAITGSNGKTTNKNLLYKVLSQRFRAHSTTGNFNNHIGLPLTILNAPTDTQFLLLEMGTNHFGEIQELCSIAQPDFGSIINIGKSHLEFLHSIEGVLKAKAELADALLERNGKLFLNEEEESLVPLSGHPVEKIPFDMNQLPGGGRLHILQSAPDIKLEIKDAQGESTFIHSVLWGHHNVLNLLHAIAIGLYFGVDVKNLGQALSEYVPGNNRSQIIIWKGHKVYLDAYNANPTSMESAIRGFRSVYPDQGILVLGDMGELGDVATREHQAILALVEELDFNQVYLIGEEFRRSRMDRYPGFIFLNDVSELSGVSFAVGEPILIKGSRFMALERLLED